MNLPWPWGMLLEGVLGMWTLWIMLHLAVMAWAVPDLPCCTAFGVHMPHWLHNILDDDEFAALEAHERGHFVHRHVWRNFLRVCFFCGTPKYIREFQEIQADEYACAQGHRAALIRALNKLGPVTEFDKHRVIRMGGSLVPVITYPRDADNPTVRDGRSSSGEKQ